MSDTKPRLVGVSVDRSVDLVGAVTVGRAETNDLRLTQGHPSRAHARLEVEGGDVWVEDVGSTNGTFVNGTRIEQRTRLNPGDEVAFDTERYRFEAAAAAGDQATVMRPMPELDATVVSPSPAADPAPPEAEAPTPAAETGPPPVQEPPPKEAAPKEPASKEAVAAASGARRPGSWADAGPGDAGGTRMLDAAELARYQAEEGAPAELAEPTQAPTLLVRSGEAAGRRIVLDGSGDADVWTVGSDDDRNVVLPDAGVSGFHAKVVHEAGRWKVIDQMSANGTFVNDRKSNISFLGDGDRVRFGPVECVVRLPAGRAAGPAPGGARSGGGTKWIAIASFVVVLGGVLAAVFLLG
ncbi:MAG: FHA domain-containing protein [Pseudomonadales bacterium]|jgi:pSer/pThr/pTyr-binding forkhead associated (FHA) protein|nr:FHA domain-containing protein [Pseudomonadales bacterium]